MNSLRRREFLMSMPFLGVATRLRMTSRYDPSAKFDLKVSEVVDAPNWVVSAFVPLNIFHS